MKVRTALTRSLSLQGVKRANQDQLLEAQDFLSLMLDEWSGDDLTLYEYTEETFSLVVGQSSYTIGTGGDFNTARPLSLKSAYLQESSTQHHPIGVITRDQYNAIYDKTVSARPKNIFYAEEYPLGKIYTDYVSDETYTLVLNSSKAMQDITSASLDSDINLPRHQLRAVIYNLAVSMTDVHRPKFSAATYAIAERGLERLMESNTKPLTPAKMSGTMNGISDPTPNSWTQP